MPRVAAKKTVIAEEIPEASEISSVTSDVEVKPEVAFKGLTKADMAKLLMQALGAEAVAELTSAKKTVKKVTKKEDKPEKEKKEKKAGSQPKGKVPKQLLKPRAWVEFTLAHALENGWEEFVIHQSKKDKETGEVVEEEIVMPGSELNDDGCYVYEGTIGSSKYPSGRQMIQKEAMSLSKQRWAPKTKTGTNPELYEEFEAQYEEPEDDDEDAKSEKSENSSKQVKRMTIAEKEAEQAAKKAAKEAEKEAKKAEKEAEKAAKKAAKEAEKAAKASEKVTAPKKAVSSAKTPIPAAAAKTILAKKAAEAKTAKSTASIASLEEEEEEKPAPKPVPAKKPIAKKDTWTCPDDGQLHPWTFGGKKYLRMFSGEVYEAADDGGCGEWAGMWDASKNKIDDSFPEPEYED
jgi:hypothetical protein